MAKTNNSHDIIDKKYLIRKIGTADALPELRSIAMPIISDAYSHARANMKQRFLVDGNSASFIASNALIIDSIIQVLTEIAKPFVTAGTLAIVAVGGYGRSELFPYSDIDLLFIHDQEDSGKDAAFVEWLLYCLWDLSLTIVAYRAGAPWTKPLKKPMKTSPSGNYAARCKADMRQRRSVCAILAGV